VAFSPDGTLVITGSQDGTAKLWNAATGGFFLTYSGHTGAVYSVAFSPDGTQVLTGSLDGTAKLWNAYTGALIRTFSGHTSSVYSVAFSPDGTKVLTGSYDNTAKLWNLFTGEAIRTFYGHVGGIFSAVFSPDGSQVLTGAADATAKLWNAATGEVNHSFSCSYTVHSVAFSPDGTRLAAGLGSGAITLWNAATYASIGTLSGHTSMLNSLAFSPDSRRLLSGSDDHYAKLWNASTGAVFQTFSSFGVQVYAVAFSPDGNRALFGLRDNTARLETTALAGTIVINNDLAVTNSPQVSLALAWAGGEGSGAVRMRFSDDGAHWTAWEALAATRAYTLPAGDGYKTVRVQFLDQLNNRSAAFSDYIRLDTAVPTGSIVINGGASVATSQKVTLGLTYTDGSGSGVVRMRFSDDGAHWSNWEYPRTAKTWTLPLPNGYHTVRVQYLDAANNYSPVYSDYIKLQLPS